MISPPDPNENHQNDSSAHTSTPTPEPNNPKSRDLIDFSARAFVIGLILTVGIFSAAAADAETNWIYRASHPGQELKWLGDTTYVTVTRRSTLSEHFERFGIKGIFQHLKGKTTTGYLTESELTDIRTQDPTAHFETVKNSRDDSPSTTRPKRSRSREETKPVKRPAPKCESSGTCDIEATCCRGCALEWNYAKKTCSMSSAEDMVCFYACQGKPVP
jgi:hypothetical protein